MASIEDLIAAYTLGSVSGLDTGTGKRDVDLTDPNVYTDTELVDEPLPDDLIYVTRGEGLDKKRYVGNKDRDMNFLKKAALGVLDAIVDNTKAGGKTFNFDWDRQNLIPEDEYHQKRLVERRRKADLSGDAVPSPDKVRKRIESQRIQDAYEIGKQRDQLDYIFQNYPEYQRRAYAAMMPLIAESRRISEDMPSSIQARLYGSALAARQNAARAVDMVNAATNAAQSGLGLHSGIRVQGR